jgi:hypothetical protein
MKNINQIFVFIAFLGVLFLTACNKEKGGVTPNVLKKLEKATYSDGNFENFTYDANGRITRLDTKDYYNIYSYNATTVTEAYVFFNPNSTVPTSTYTLNAQGLAVYETFTSSTYNYVYEYEYNANGSLTRYASKYKPASSTLFTKSDEGLYTYNSDGDLLSIRFLNGSGIQTSKTDFEYDKNHYNTTGREFNGYGVFGKSANHFITKQTNTPSTGAATITTFSAFFDAKGYITSRTRTTGTTVITSSYTYK